MNPISTHIWCGNLLLVCQSILKVSASLWQWTGSVDTRRCLALGTDGKVLVSMVDVCVCVQLCVCVGGISTVSGEVWWVSCAGLYPSLLCAPLGAEPLIVGAL